MIPVDVSSLALDSKGEPVVILRPIDAPGRSGPVLPIWVGMQEANAIMLAAQGTTAARPMSYDLMARLLKALEGTIAQVAVTRLEQGTFFAEITLESPSGRHVIDARPSDSIALAMRVDAPILVAETVFSEAGVSFDEPSTEDEEEEQIQEFSEFLDSIDPEDFRG